MPTPARRPSILIADACEDTRALYRASREMSHYEVVEASDGREALTHALQRTPALVITELALPFIDGCALCAILRRDGATSGVPILAITTETRSEHLHRARQAGVDSLLVKPTRIDDVLNEVQRLLDAFKDGRPASIKSFASPSDAVPPSPSPRRSRASTFVRYVTKTPPFTPPPFVCPTCDRPLVYQQSRIGGVSERQREQWDQYSCGTCGTFQYRHRTRRLSQDS